MDAVARMQLLDWTWLYPPLEKDIDGALTEEDRHVLLQELHRFIAVKVATEDLDSKNDLSSTGLVDSAFHTLLLNPFFCSNLMRILGRPGQVLSHVPADRADHEDRVREYFKQHNKIFKRPGTTSLPSGRELWPMYLLRKRAAGQSRVGEGNQRAQRPRGTGTGRLYLKTLTGKTLTYTVPHFCKATLEDMAIYVESSEGLPLDQQRFIFQGQMLPFDGAGDQRQMAMNKKLLTEFGIQKESTIHLVLKLRGC